MRSLLRRLVHHPFTRLVLSFLVAGIVTMLLTLATGWLTPPGGGLGALLLAAVLRLTAALVALLGVGRYLEQRSPAQLGLGLRGSVRLLGWGALLGTGLMTLVAAVLALAGWYTLVAAPTAASRSRDVLMWLAILAAASFTEELYFRGMAFRLLEEWLGSGAALVVSSAFFGLAHLNNEGASVLAAVSIALEAGLLLGGCYMLTRSLWFPTAVHVAWNCTEGVLLGVPVSGNEVASVFVTRLEGPEAWTGGVFGPEAGGVSLLLATLVGCVIIAAAIRRGQWKPFLSRRRAPAAQAES